MEKETFYWKLFGWFVYASRMKLHVFPARQDGMNNLVRKMREVRNSRYHEKKGCCEYCGKHFKKADMQMETMERLTNSRGINLRQEYQQAAAIRWNNRINMNTNN